MIIKDNREITIEFGTQEVLDILIAEALRRMHQLGLIDHPNLEAPANKKLYADFTFSIDNEKIAEIPGFSLILSEDKVQEKVSETKGLTWDGVQS